MSEIPITVEGYVDAMELFFDGCQFALTTALHATAKSNAEEISLFETPKSKPEGDHPGPLEIIYIYTK